MIKWTGTITSVLGAFTVALGFMLPGYSLFLIGAVCWSYIGFKQKDNALLTLNLVFMAANIIGFTRAVI